MNGKLIEKFKKEMIPFVKALVKDMMNNVEIIIEDNKVTYKRKISK